MQPTGNVSACLNAGICKSKDNCICRQSDSILYNTYRGALRGPTGWTGKEKIKNDHNDNNNDNDNSNSDDNDNSNSDGNDNSKLIIIIIIL